MGKKKCDLCEGVARMYCESDQASLCWDCDAQVHGANFLVAKHTRCLLCTACQSLTPWKAAGLRLGPTFSVCESCVALKSGVRIVSDDRSQEMDGSEHEVDSAESYDDDEDEDEEDDDVDEEEAEIQVVPWSAAAAAQLPPMMSSSSSNGGGDLVGKRRRDCSDEEIGSSSGQELSYSPPLKRPSREKHAFKSTAAVNSLNILEGEGTTLNDRAVDSSPSSSSSLIVSRTRRDVNR
ncbi:unnamed protein product [Eruca vesicaria subsp. sativa]|uniref:B box-type domain-containing protein n=1 Tax=Eruca vesicaria subsp. sativa TaxID=29727 RepID=A0ABC8LNG7_ERUVS|nr:unnamed protein product [Eruca vesicaria subsp. sativa]